MVAQQNICGRASLASGEGVGESSPHAATTIKTTPAMRTIRGT